MRSVWVDGERSSGRKQFGEGDSGKDQGGPQEGAAAQMLVQYEERGEAGEDWFEGQEDRSVGGGKMLLGPALDGKGGSGRQKASNGEGYDQAESD